MVLPFNGSLDKLQWFVQTTIPTIYDDSLSYYELLNKVAKQLDTNTDFTNGVKDSLNEIINFVNSSDWVDNAKLKDGAIDTKKIYDGAVTLAKLDPSITAQPVSAIGQQAKFTDIDNKLKKLSTLDTLLVQENIDLISPDNSPYQKHVFDPFEFYERPKDKNVSDATDYVYAPSSAIYNGVLYLIWRSASGHTSSDGKIKMLTRDVNGVWTNEKVILPNTSERSVYNANLIISASGVMTITYFERNAAQECYTKYIRSSDLGVTWSNPIALPTPPNVLQTANAGNHTVKDGVIYQSFYTLDNKAYVIKSADDGLTWSYVGFISETVPLNETCLVYVPADAKFYAISRSAEQKAGVTPFADYENFLYVTESTDGTTWGEPYPIPVYGHAPSGCVISTDRIALSYANRSRKYTDGKYSCDVVILKKGKPFTNSLRLNRSTNYDGFYSNIVNDGTNVHLVYYQDNSAIRYHKFLVTTLTDLSYNDRLNMSKNFSNNPTGYYITPEGFYTEWINSTEALNLNTYTVKRYTLPKSFPTRGYGANASISSTDSTANTLLQNVWCDARIIDASTVEVVIRNMTASNITATGNLRIVAYGG